MDRYKLLIIEDSQTQAAAVAAHLTEHDLDVIIANDGPQGLRMASVMQPNLIILDVNLPTMDGYQVCRRLKRDITTSNIPVIMLTGEKGSKERELGFAAGADDYIVKDANSTAKMLSKIKDYKLIG